jgi:kinesin family protein 1
MWQKRFGHHGEIVLSQDPVDIYPEAMSSATSSRSFDVDPEDTIKLASTTTLVPRSDTPTKKGHMLLLVDANQNTWIRRWFVLRRPYLHIYAHSNELEEVGIASLIGVNVVTNPEFEALLGKRFCFTLFTSTNSYALSAPNQKDLLAWTAKLDPTRVHP